MLISLCPLPHITLRVHKKPSTPRAIAAYIIYQGRSLAPPPPKKLPPSERQSAKRIEQITKIRTDKNRWKMISFLKSWSGNLLEEKQNVKS